MPAYLPKMCSDEDMKILSNLKVTNYPHKRIQSFIGAYVRRGTSKQEVRPESTPI